MWQKVQIFIKNFKISSQMASNIQDFIKNTVNKLIDKFNKRK
jgi:hypothetical protein